MSKKEPQGMDIVGEEMDYTKSFDKNEKKYKERYKKIYGKYPEENKEN